MSDSSLDSFFRGCLLLAALEADDRGEGQPQSRKDSAVGCEPECAANLTVKIPSALQFATVVTRLATEDEAAIEKSNFAFFAIIGAIGGSLGDVGAVIVEQEAGGFVLGRRGVGGEGKPEGKGEFGVEFAAGGGGAREKEGAVCGVERGVEAGCLAGGGLGLRFATAAGGKEKIEGNKD